MIYGIRTVIETIQSGKDLEKVFIQKNLTGELIKELKLLTRQRKIPVSMVPQEKIIRFTTKNHQGVVAFVSPVQYHTLEQLLPSVYERGEVPFFVVMDGITDVRNFGGIARSAECMGAHGIIIPSKGNSQINADALKTSAGALNFIPVCREKNILVTLKYLQESGLQVIACTEKANKELPFVDVSGPVVVVLGSEEEGISMEILSMADQAARIPQSGQISSLNVGSAASMVFYEIVRQRMLNK